MCVCACEHFPLCLCLSTNAVLSRPHDGYSITFKCDGTTLLLYGCSEISPEQMAAADRDTDRERVCLVFGFAGVELSQGALRDPLQHLFGEDPHQLPSDVQGLEHAPVLVGTCTHAHVGISH